MANKNDLLIVEMSSSQLKVAEGENKEYILEGIFGEIDAKNKNNRIYTEDEYVPQIQQLQDCHYTFYIHKKRLLLRPQNMSKVHHH